MKPAVTILHAGFHRVEAQLLAGPMPGPTGATSREIARIDTALAVLAEELKPPTDTPEGPAAEDELIQQLYDYTMQMYERFVAADSDPSIFDALPDGWLALLADRDPCFHDWASICFLKWGENGLQDLIAELVDGEAGKLIDEQYADCVESIPRYDLQRQRSHLRRRRQSLEEKTAQVFPHRQVQKGTANVSERAATAQTVPNLFEGHESWWAALRDIQWHDLPSTSTTGRWISPTEKPCFMVIHLFSGRRRRDDFHAALHHEAARQGFDIVVLSCDTAISACYGDLTADQTPWKQILRLFRLGRIAGASCGPPCETYTEARYHQPEPAADNKPEFPWPRPLRSWARLLGLQNCRTLAFVSLGRPSKELHSSFRRCWQ